MNEECEHDWKKEYYGLRCANCQLFYPDNGNYFAPLDDEYHSVLNGLFYMDDEPGEPYGYVDGEPDYTLDDLEWDELFGE